MMHSSRCCVQITASCVELTRCVDACRSWHQLATCDDCWTRHLRAAYPRSFSRMQQQQQQRRKKKEDCNNPAAAPLLAAGVYARFCSEAASEFLCLAVLPVCV